MGQQSSKFIIRRTSRVPKPIERYGFNVVEVEEEPKTMKQALESKNKNQWQQAMNKGLNALIEDGTWEITELPKGKKPIDSKWCYKIKRNSKGEIERYKARLVIKG